MSPDLCQFLHCMDGEWEVIRYELEDDGKLRVHYRSCLNPLVEWSHNPMGDFGQVPAVGTRGMLGFCVGKTPGPVCGEAKE